MRSLTKLSLAVVTAAAIITATAFIEPKQSSKTIHLPVQTKAAKPKIQVAVLLDVSGSMDGLIEQAKAQLWNMVSVMGKAQYNNMNEPAQIEIALYEYGRDNNDAAKGYIKQISAFTTDLDGVSKNLFKLTTNGGSEYCGQVIYTSLKELTWDTASQNYRVIFIAGNEDFLQGSVTYTKACEEAKKKGVIVNTIYCGDKQQGIREHWNLGAECGMGSFTHIDQNAKQEDIPTPYDSTLFTLNTKLNNTYIAYGYEGKANAAKQAEVDNMNYEMNKSVAVQRVTVKSKSSLYKNSGWDLVDAYKDDKTIVTKVDLKTLPENLKNKSRAEIETIVKQKQTERGTIQKEIETVSEKRTNYIVAEKAKSAKTTNATLETEVERIIKEQAKRFNMKIE